MGRIVLLFVLLFCFLAAMNCAEEEKDSKGKDSKGGDSGGSESKGNESGGSESKGNESGGSESKGNESGGSESKGKESGGSESKGKESGGSESKGKESGGSESKGNESGGSESKGNESGGSENKGNESGGNESKGNESGGSENKGSESGGSKSKGNESGGSGSKGNESGGNENKGKGTVEEICGKGQGDEKPETPEERKEETEAEENKDNEKDKKFFYSGDMRITQKQKEQLERARSTGHKRDALKRENAKWPNATVYYVIDPRMDKKGKEAIEAGIRDIEQYTCISFVKKVDRSIEHFVKFIKSNGCWSYVGMLSSNALRAGYRQEISIGRGCEYKGTAIHEIFHALGFVHEQSRRDRDKYVKIRFENVQAGMRNNFDIAEDSMNLGIAYDYNSIMHYPDWAFSKNGKPTIEAIGNTVGAEIGQRDGMTAGDIEQVNKYYECDKQTNSGSGFSYSNILKRELKDEKKPGDKKGGKCQAQYENEQKNRERKMAWKESLMKKQLENEKRFEAEDKIAGMLKRRKKH